MFKLFYTGLILSCGFYGFVSCSERPHRAEAHFTKADSVTESYLDYKDSMLHVWNAMIRDDNQKIASMRNLLHELKVTQPAERKEFERLEKRLALLLETRYTQHSMANQDVIVEYDFATKDLISEIITAAANQKQFSYNTTLQKLVEEIGNAQERSERYRKQYDAIAIRYNDFIEKNRLYLDGIDADSIAQRPLFRTVSEH